MNKWPPPFYRYIRPLQFDRSRTELVTNPKGGVCLRFAAIGDSLWFTHARCDLDEFFSKEVAKKCTDVRAAEAIKAKYHVNGYCGSLPVTKNTEELLTHVLRWSENWVPDVKEASVLYHAFELKELASALNLISFVNEQQTRLADDWKTSLAAANYAEMYDNLR